MWDKIKSFFDGGCMYDHKWETIDVREAQGCRITYILRCKRCGDITYKVVNLR